MELEFPREIFEKPSDIKFRVSSASGCQLFHRNGQTDRLDEANSRFSQFCERS